jgi:hypothetical protein
MIERCRRVVASPAFQNGVLAARLGAMRVQLEEIEALVRREHGR